MVSKHNKWDGLDDINLINNTRKKIMVIVSPFWCLKVLHMLGYWNTVRRLEGCGSKYTFSQITQKLKVLDIMMLHNTHINVAMAVILSPLSAF